MGLNQLSFSCPHCKASGSVKFGGHVTPFDAATLKGDFKFEMDKPHNAIRCKCARLLVVVRAERGMWRVIDLSDRDELKRLAIRLAALHRNLENSGKMDADWRVARSLEDRIGSYQCTSAKDIAEADALLAKHKL